MVAGLPGKVHLPPQASLAGTLRRVGVVGVLRAPTAESAVQATLAAVRGGLEAIELTFTTPKVADALRELRNILPDTVHLGVGTIVNGNQARDAIAAGATFLVSPHLGEDVLAIAQAAGVPYVPGVLSATEIVRARRLGAEVVKLFPAGSAGGKAYLKDLLGPFPDLQVMVTGGIQPAEVSAYREAGALAVGLGSNLFPKVALQKGDWAEVERATRAALQQAGTGA